MTAHLADEHEQAILALPPSSPVMVIKRLVTGHHGTRLAYSRVVYRSDRYEYEVTVTR